MELPRSLVRKWLAKKAARKCGNPTGTDHRRSSILQVLVAAGYSAYVPDSTFAARKPSTFVPRMLTDEELAKVSFSAVDALEPTASSPLRHLIMPEVFRLLYGCGFRVREVLKLRVRDVDLESRHHHGSPGEIPQRSVGSSRLAPGEPLAKICCPF